MRRSAFLAAAIAAAAAAAEPPPEPRLASPPALRRAAQVDLPPGTVFPGPEVVVVLSLDVGADGKVERAEIEQGAGEPFDAAALEAARALEFEPARLEGGEAAPVTISFRLRIRAPPAPAPPAERPKPVRLGGTLLERGTRRPLPDVPVEARAGDRTLAAGSTDARGRFTLEVPEPEFTLLAVPPAHRRLEVRVVAVAGEEREGTWYLEALPRGYSTVVRGERVRSEITRQVLPADEVESLPGTQGDTLKAVLNLPGVARPSFGGGNLVLRGSAPGDSAVFLEGYEIPLLYHFGGLRSTFAPRFLEAVDFVPGNFAADYGRLTGGIVGVRVREPARDLVRGEADFNLYDAGVAVEGPLSERWAGGAAFRRSWVDAILPLVIPRDAPISFRTAPRFYDYQFLAEWKPDDREKLRVLFFGSQDALEAILERPADDPIIQGDLRARLAFHTLLLAWSRAMGPALRQETSLGLGLQEFDTQVGPQLFFKLTTNRVDARSTWSWQALPKLALRGGLDLRWVDADVSLAAPRPPIEGEPPTPVSTRPRVAASKSVELYAPAAFAELRWTPDPRLSLFPSLRVDWTRAIRRWSVDPRVGARFAARAGTTLKAAAGLYQQAPQPEQSDPSLGTPTLRLQRSLQLSAGAEQRVGEGVDLDGTLFYKALDRRVVSNPDFRTNPAATPYANDGTGRIFGAELLLRARLGERFFGWIAYTWQRSFRTDHPGDPERRFSFDQPHIFTALGSWRLSARWALGARFRLVSGNPYTPVSGSVYEAGSDVFVPIFGAVNSGRLGTFWALDFRADRFWTFERWRLSAYLDVQNATNRANQEGWQYRYDYRDKTPLTGLPILPIFGLKAEW